MKLSARHFAAVALAVFAVSSASTTAAVADDSTLDVGVVIYDKTAVLDSVGPTAYLELLSLVGQYVNIITVANRTGRIQPTTLLPLYSNTSYADAPSSFDILIIPGGPGRTAVISDTAFIDYITRAAEASTFVMSVCTGADILATTGLLDGRNATTNKMAFKTIAAAHPNVNWIRQARWAVDGKYWTSSGVSAGLDMGHAFVAAQYGNETAALIAKVLEIVPITDPTNDPFVSSIGG